ncbi:hypothetical protein PSTG_19222, partial [Puccinia striiformis f. sp. tritici PST-78]
HNINIIITIVKYKTTTNEPHHHHHHHHHHPPAAPRSVPNLYQQAQISQNSFSSTQTNQLDHSNQSLPSHLSPARSRSGSLRQPNKSIPPPLRLTGHGEPLPRAYQSGNSATTRSQPASTTTASSLPPNPNLAA